MAKTRFGALTALVALVLASPAAVRGSRAAAVQAPGGPLVESTVSGTLVIADPTLNQVVIRTASGEKLDWQLPAAVVAEAGHYKAGDPVTVVYRTVGEAERSLRALKFTGPGSKASYVNATGNHVVLRTGPKVGGQCGSADAPASQVVGYPLIPSAVIEDTAGCWCCGPGGTTCRPSNTVLPRDHIVLAECFD
jgi:hypothetical protein